MKFSGRRGGDGKDFFKQIEVLGRGDSAATAVQEVGELMVGDLHWKLDFISSSAFHLGFYQRYLFKSGRERERERERTLSWLKAGEFVEAAGTSGF